jgi:hypothetical protein
MNQLVAADASYIYPFLVVTSGEQAARRFETLGIALAQKTRLPALDKPSSGDGSPRSLGGARRREIGR